MKRWKIEPLDTLFFRGGQPFNAGESVYVESLFPPSPETAMGLVRTSILYRHANDLASYAAGTDGATRLAGVDLFVEIGNPKRGGAGKLNLQGPFPVRDDTLLFPFPLDMARTYSGLAFLRPGKPRVCDLGKVRLPVAVGEGLKVLARVWVSAGGMEKLLAESLPREEDLIYEEVPEGFLCKNVQSAKRRERAALYITEPRVGIARDNNTKTAKEGHLYAIAPLRLLDGVKFILGVGGIDIRLHPAAKQVVRFGGEGKLVQITCDGLWSLPRCPSPPPENRDRTRFRVVLATPGRFQGWFPHGFQKADVDGETRWTGRLNDLPCEIVSACAGKAIRLGGWDLVKNESKALESCVPAGSVYFCETDAPWDDVLRLHGQSVGTGSEIGFGHMLIGRWT